MKLVFHGLGEVAEIGSGQVRITEGSDHSLAWRTFGITISLNELE